MNAPQSLYSIIKLLFGASFLYGTSKFQCLLITNRKHSLFGQAKILTNNPANNCQIKIEINKTVIADDIR